MASAGETKPLPRHAAAAAGLDDGDGRHHPDFGAFKIQSLALGALPLALVAAVQAFVVISGGIDLSIGSLIAVSNVLSASLMQHASFGQALALSLLVLVCSPVQGFLNGLIVAASRIPDVVATLTTGFIWGGIALMIMERPGGGAPAAYLNIAARADFWPWLPLCSQQQSCGRVSQRRQYVPEIVQQLSAGKVLGYIPIDLFAWIIVAAEFCSPCTAPASADSSTPSGTIARPAIWQACGCGACSSPNI